MPKVSRRLVAAGEFCTVECAVRADGVTSPAAAFLDHLAEGVWAEDPDFQGRPDQGVPDDAQIGDFDKLLAWCQLLADDGVPAYRGAVNSLNDGMWEFKVGAKRLSFFDTPGDGSYEPKPRITDRDEADRPDEEYWWFPDFDEYIRLGYAFSKNSQRTDPRDIRETLQVREEDLSHDC